MALGHWIAIGIVVVAIIILIGGLIYAVNQFNTPLEKVQQLQETVNDKANFYQSEVQTLQNKIETQSKQGQALADQALIEKEKFDHLTKESKQLANQVSYIRDMRGEVMNAALDQGKDYVQNDLPRHFEKLKLIAKKTANKQKDRYSEQA